MVDKFVKAQLGDHYLNHDSNGWRCVRCSWTWKNKPTDDKCPGVQRFASGCWPHNYFTYNQLRQRGMMPIGAPCGCCLLPAKNGKQRRWAWLYDIEKAKQVQ